MTKKVLFVTYGGGHARMVIPVLAALKEYSGITTETLALTTAGSIFKSEGIPYKGYKDFITADDKDALRIGKKLAAEHHKPQTGIEEEESVAYFGLSYWDLVLQHGETEAAALWESNGRHAFLQLSVLERIIDQVKPDMVVTTNSPKSEHAAIIVAKKRGIPNISMVDLFGVQHFYTLESDYITVLMEGVVNNLLENGVNRPREAFLITGNPAFDRAFDGRGPIDYNWRHTHYPAIPDDGKILLWLDQPAYWNMQFGGVHTRNDEEMIQDLERLSNAAKANGVYLLVRPHPSQQRSLFENWIADKKSAHIFFAGDLPLYPLLRAIDVVVSYTSTVFLEALLMERRVIQLKKAYSGRSDVPIADWGLGWQAQDRNDFTKVVHDAFNDNDEWQKMRERIASILPQERAGPKVASHINRILFQT